VLTVRGRSSLARWRIVGVQFALGLAVAVSIVALWLAVGALMQRGFFSTDQGALSSGRLPGFSYMLIALGIVLLASWGYAVWVRLTIREQDADTIKDAHREASHPRPIMTPGWASIRDRKRRSHELLDATPHAGHMFPWGTIAHRRRQGDTPPTNPAANRRTGSEHQPRE